MLRETAFFSAKTRQEICCGARRILCSFSYFFALYEFGLIPELSECLLCTLIKPIFKLDEKKSRFFNREKKKIKNDFMNTDFSNSLRLH